jgi:hypothetical protein
MELIPILSTIILVATISTFLLAIGAYILYKIRESKDQRIGAQKPMAVKAEIISPAELPASQPEQARGVAAQPVFVDVEQPGQNVNRQPAFTQLRRPAVKQRQAQQGWQQQQAAQAGQFNNGYQQRGYDNGILNSGGAQAAPSNKFYKYTTEGYVSPKEDKQSGAMRWR